MKNTGQIGNDLEIEAMRRDRVRTYRPVRARTVCAKKRSTPRNASGKNGIERYTRNPSNSDIS